MATEAQITANQINAQSSTGPKTESGKARSSRNAVKHGLRSQDFVVAPEDTEEFEELRDNLRKQMNPPSGLGDVLFTKLLEAAWNQCRCRRAEAALRNELGIDPLLADGAAQKRFATVERYSRRADRAFQYALKELRQLQTETFYRESVEEMFDDLDLSHYGVADTITAHKAFRTWDKHPTDLQYRNITNQMREIDLARLQHNEQTKPMAA